MRRTVLVTLAILLPLLSCTLSKRMMMVAPDGKYKSPSLDVDSKTAGIAAFPEGQGGITPVSLQAAAVAQATASSPSRKIIRNAELIVEINSPAEGQRRVATIAEAVGGFVVTSEFRQVGEAGPSAAATIRIVVRVPAAQFTIALEGIRGLGGRVKSEKIVGQDVTEEYIDLEARLRAKTALESQFLEIMKQAKKVPDALEVQKQLTEVRTEIERLEGRRRFLENQTSLSTITVTLESPEAIVKASMRSGTPGFLAHLKQSFSEGMDDAADVIVGTVRAIIVLVPILLLIVLPLGLLVRTFFRRLRRAQKPQPAPQT